MTLLGDAVFLLLAIQTMPRVGATSIFPLAKLLVTFGIHRQRRRPTLLVPALLGYLLPLPCFEFIPAALLAQRRFMLRSSGTLSFVALQAITLIRTHLRLALQCLVGALPLKVLHLLARCRRVRGFGIDLQRRTCCSQTTLSLRTLLIFHLLRNGGHY